MAGVAGVVAGGLVNGAFGAGFVGAGIAFGCATSGGQGGSRAPKSAQVKR